MYQHRPKVSETRCAKFDLIFAKSRLGTISPLSTETISIHVLPHVNDVRTFSKDYFTLEVESIGEHKTRNSFPTGQSYHL
jgi:hypothetical protein